MNVQTHTEVQKLHPRWRSLVLPAIITLYLAFLAGYGLLWLVKSDQLWQIDVLSNFTLWYFLPAPVLIIVALLLKRRRWALSLLIVIVIALVKYAPFFFPRTVNGPPTLTVMTLNMLKRNTNWSAVQTQIQSANADVVTIQEIPNAFLKDEWAKLEAAYPYSVHAYSSIEESNMGLLSRYPIIEQSAFRLPDNYNLTHIRVVLDLNGQKMVVYNLHLAAPEFTRTDGQSRFIGRIFPYQYSAFYRRWQAGAFYPRLAQETLPVLVMGDFNTADSSGDYGRFKDNSGLQDTFDEVGLGMGFTFPVELMVKDKAIPFFSLMRLDYVWHSAQWQALSAWVGGATGSDHLPVVAKLRLN